MTLLMGSGESNPLRKCIVIEGMYVFENISEDTSEMNSYLAPYGGFDAVRALLESGEGFMEVHSDGYRIRQVYFQNQGENEFMVAFVGSDDGTIPMIQVSIVFNKTTGWAISNEMILGSNSINNHKPIFRIYANPWELDKTKAQMDALLLSFGGFDSVKARLISGNALLCCANGSIAIQCANYGTNKFSVLFIGADDGYFDSIVAVNVIFDKENGISIEDTYDIAYGNSSATSFSPVVLTLPITEDYQIASTTTIDSTVLNAQYNKYGGFSSMINKILKDGVFYITGVSYGDTSTQIKRLAPIFMSASTGGVFAGFFGSDDFVSYGMFNLRLYPTYGEYDFYGYADNTFASYHTQIQLSDGFTLDAQGLEDVCSEFWTSGVDSLAYRIEYNNAYLTPDKCFCFQMEKSSSGKLVLYYNKVNVNVLETYKVVLEEGVGVNVTKLI